MFDALARGAGYCTVLADKESEQDTTTHAIGDVLRRRSPEDIVIVGHDGLRVTAQQALDRSAAMAADLAAAGIRAGDRVAVLHDLSVDALLLWWALGRLGAVYLPLNPTWTTRLAARVVTGRAPVALIAEPRHRALADRATAGTGTRVLDVAEVSDHSGDAVDDGPRGFHECPAAPTDDCCIVHNSGRPGIDHGVRASWRMFSVMAGNMSAMHPVGRSLVAAPPCFLGVLLSVYGAVSAGGSVALLPGLTADSFWPAVRAAGVTSAAMLNPTLSDMLARPAGPEDRDHPLRMMVGNPNEAELNARAGRRFGVHWVCGLGKTEVCGAVSTGTDPTAEEGVGRVRAPFVGRIVDPASDAPVAPGRAGELVLRCEVDGGLPVGYADDDEATAELWRGGWLHTGWHVREDAQGNLHPVGQNSIHPIVVKRSGYMFAADLEREIVAAGAGITGARVGTRPGADQWADPTVVAWLTGTGLDQATVGAALRAGLPAHLVPDLVVPVTTLPTGPDAYQPGDTHHPGTGPGDGALDISDAWRLSG